MEEPFLRAAINLKIAFSSLNNFNSSLSQLKLSALTLMCRGQKGALVTYMISSFITKMANFIRIPHWCQLGISQR